jgi:hypothetical protein
MMLAIIDFFLKGIESSWDTKFKNYKKKKNTQFDYP